MIQITNATIYSMKGEVAYQVDYSEGSQVRAVVGKDGWIRKEFKINGEWKLSGKSYKVRSDRKRQAERLIDIAKQFLQ
jgi:hypothetical protein